MITICANYLTVEGKALDIMRFMNLTTQGGPAEYHSRKRAGKSPSIPRKTGYFSFNSLLPVPEYVLRMGEISVPQHISMKMGEVKLEKRIACGEDWCIRHWGCPRDVWDQKITKKKMGCFYGSNDRATLDFSFETINTPPVRWFEEAFARFPELTFQVHYELRGQLAHGYILGLDGETWESGILKEPADIFACPESDSDENETLPQSSADSSLPF